MRFPFAMVIFALLASITVSPRSCCADDLQQLDNCQYVETQWGDGDSFLVRDAKGKEFTVRLYGVDCVEARVTDDADATRLREQRRYFGISGLGGSPQSSIEAARNFGKQATEFVKQELKKPFTVYTAFADARGDAKFDRVYAFVTCSDGEDLGLKLVENGLARAFGVYRAMPDGRSRDEFREWIKDAELLAIKKGKGIWGSTDWESLPDERKQARDEIAELELAKGAAELASGVKINLNTAARDELMRLPGIGEVLAIRIIEARPFSSIESVSSVPGVGEKKFERMKEFLTID